MRNYLWLGVIRNIGQYVEGCDICQRIKNRTRVLVGKLKLSEVLEKPWTYLIVDFIMKSLLVAGKNVVLVVCNRLSKITYFVETTERTLVKELMRLFRDNAWKLYRLSESIILDRDLQFVAKITRKLNICWGLK